MRDIYDKPVLDKISEINASNNFSILLAGARGTGKSTIVEKYLELDNNAINCTFDPLEYIKIVDEQIFKIYEISMLLDKLIDFIKINHPDYYLVFSNLHLNIKHIIEGIKNMAFVDCYENKYNVISRDLYYNPEKLFDEFWKRFSQFINIRNITLVIDDFDYFGSSNTIYQETIYNLLKDKFRTIYVVSDLQKLDELKGQNDIVVVDYAYEVEKVKNILDKLTIKDLIREQGLDFSKRIYFILDDDIIQNMIDISNGNILYMYYALKRFLRELDDLEKEEYERYIIKELNNIINKYTNLGFTRERRLHI